MSWPRWGADCDRSAEIWVGRAEMTRFGWRKPPNVTARWTGAGKVGLEVIGDLNERLVVDSAFFCPGRAKRHVLERFRRLFVTGLERCAAMACVVEWIRSDVQCR
jgi:hypothetical protein